MSDPSRIQITPIEPTVPIGAAVHLVAEPGDGTRYDLVVVQDPHGGWLVAWSAAGALFWASARRGGEVRRKGTPVTVAVPEPPDYDCQRIGELLDETVRARTPDRHPTQGLSAAAGVVLVASGGTNACRDGAHDWTVQRASSLDEDIVSSRLALSAHVVDGPDVSLLTNRKVVAARWCKRCGEEHWLVDVPVLPLVREGWAPLLATDGARPGEGELPALLPCDAFRPRTPDSAACWCGHEAADHEAERRRRVFELAASLTQEQCKRLVAMRIADPDLHKLARAPVTEVDELWRSLVHLGLVRLEKANLKMVVHGQLAQTTPLGAQVRALRVAWTTTQWGAP